MCVPAALALVPAAVSAIGGASGVAAITTGVGALGSIASYIGTQSAGHAAKAAANRNYAAKVEQLGRENVQLSERQTEENLTDAVAQAQAFGRIATSAGAMGLGQYSSHRLISTNASAYNRALGIRDKNYDNQRANLQTEQEGADLQRQTAIAQAPKANLGTLALSLAGNALQGVSTYGALGGKFGVQPVGAPS